MVAEVSVSQETAILTSGECGLLPQVEVSPPAENFANSLILELKSLFDSSSISEVRD